MPAFGKQPEGRSIVEQLRYVSELKSFGSTRWTIAEPRDVDSATHHTIGFSHALTGPGALRRIAPYIRESSARAAFPHAWQTAAALYAAYARSEDKPGREETRTTAGELVARAIRNGDDHAIRFTELMAAEHRRNPDPVYLAAAEVALARL